MANRCSLWVKSRHCTASGRCPLYPQKRTLELSRVMSALCQKQTYAAHKLRSRSAANNRRHWHSQFAGWCPEASEVVCDVGVHVGRSNTGWGGKRRARSNGAGKNGLDVAVRVGDTPVL